MKRIRVVARSKYPAVRAGLVSLLAQAGFTMLPDDDVQGTFHERPDVIVTDAVDSTDAEGDIPCVYLLDAYMESTGDDVAGAILRSDASGAQLDAAVRAAASGLAVRDPRVPRSHSADARDATLTAREIEVLQLIAAGMTNKAAALALGISPHTVKFHVGSALTKLGARSRTEAVTTATRLGLLPL